MQNHSVNPVLPLRSGLSFADSDYWDLLADDNSRYNLPDWSEPCTPVSMSLWLDRLNISKTLYMKHTGTDFVDWINMNPDWPLRSFVGFLLEIRQEEK